LYQKKLTLKKAEWKCNSIQVQ